MGWFWKGKHGNPGKKVMPTLHRAELAEGDVCLLLAHGSRLSRFVKPWRLVVCIGRPAVSAPGLCKVVVLHREVPVPAHDWHIPVAGLLAGGKVPQGLWWARCDLTEAVPAKQLVPILGPRKHNTGCSSRARVDPLLLPMILLGIERYHSQGTTHRHEEQ